jgi:hypothetical protein
MAAALLSMGFALPGAPAWAADHANQPRAAPAEGAKPASAPTTEANVPREINIDEIVAHANAVVSARFSSQAADVSLEEALKHCNVNNDIQCNSAIDLYDRKWKQEFEQQSYVWHLLSSKIIFCLVIAIVIFGLFITYLQFSRDYRDWAPAHHAPPPPPPAAPLAEGQAAAEAVMPPRPVTSLKLSAGGLELSSQVIGLIVLGLSFAFFYLYVKEIHPMVERHSELVPRLASPAEK